jgi:hypothetical protein
MPNPAPRVPFGELWKLNPRGWIGRAQTAYLRLSDAQTHATKADLEALLKRGPLPEGFGYAGTHFAMIRLGQPVAPILASMGAPAAAPARSTRIFIREGTAEWRAWQGHLLATTGRGTPTTTGRDSLTNKEGSGWYFSSRLPPLP